MAVRDVERELEKVKALRGLAPGEERTAALRNALSDKVNVVVAKAAAIAAELQETTLVPHLLAQFDRLLLNPLKSDAKCWGKDAIAKALRDLGYEESDVFLKGARHVQHEPVWGGEEDTAANLRATCALALLTCSDVTREDKLWFILPLVTETSPAVRKDAAVALEALEGREAALMLRIKARMGDDDGTVTGQVFESLLRIERDSAVPFVAEFLRSPKPEVREEAALALGASRLTPAVKALQQAFQAQFPLLDREVLYRALAISRNQDAIAFLLDLIRNGRPHEVLSALSALALYRDSTEICAKIAEACSHRNEQEIRREFNRIFGSR